MKHVRHATNSEMHIIINAQNVIRNINLSKMNLSLIKKTVKRNVLLRIII